MFLNALTRTTLIVLPLAMIAARLHANTVHGPVNVTQDVNRCLLIVRTASSRRGQPRVGTRSVPTSKPEAPAPYYVSSSLGDAA